MPSSGFQQSDNEIKERGVGNSVQSQHIEEPPSVMKRRIVLSVLTGLIIVLLGCSRTVPPDYDYVQGSIQAVQAEPEPHAPAAPKQNRRNMENYTYLDQTSTFHDLNYRYATGWNISPASISEIPAPDGIQPVDVRLHSIFVSAHEVGLPVDTNLPGIMTEDVTAVIAITKYDVSEFMKRLIQTYPEDTPETLSYLVAARMAGSGTSISQIVPTPDPLSKRCSTMAECCWRS